MRRPLKLRFSFQIDVTRAAAADAPRPGNRTRSARRPAKTAGVDHARPMRTREDVGPMWTGFLFGLGFWMAGAVVSALGAALTFAALSVSIEAQAAAAAAAAVDAARTRLPMSSTTLPRGAVVMPPRSVEECKAQTGGVLNDAFARCRRGYTDPG